MLTTVVRPLEAALKVAEATFWSIKMPPKFTIPFTVLALSVPDAFPALAVIVILRPLSEVTILLLASTTASVIGEIALVELET